MLSRFALGYESLCRFVLVALTINISMLIHTLLGVFLIGAFPSVSAAYSTWRTWFLDTDREWTVKQTWRIFHEAWKDDIKDANTLGWLETAAWLFLMYDRWILTVNGLGFFGFAASGLITVIIVAYALFTMLTWMVHVNFDETIAWTMRISLGMIVAKPLCSLLILLLLVFVVYLCIACPGVVAAFGLSGPIFGTVGCVYVVGGLPGMTRHT
ncbi:MAG: YesL family protein [Bifidobacterium sp.]|jgi:uncharacterized membrane protein YesL